MAVDIMRVDRRTPTRPTDADGLWQEAFWGLGLLGGVLMLVLAISVLFA